MTAAYSPRDDWAREDAKDGRPEWMRNRVRVTHYPARPAEPTPENEWLAVLARWAR